ncbi:FkbM family methyltransferase [Sphingopyxis granuli]|uniref:FkbM family methyltransferase n=1 Tax=Sphingopyxis granuli TaxID=267128 RepID=A0AA86L3D3_9SPHN|nr:FkbM family methyltransferase [Sphingopyxis granuli]AMG74736.1 FkbM family methyltransferase [Sphingopyxis granuli]
MKISQIVKRLGEERQPVRFLASRILARTGAAERLGLQIRRRGYQLHFFNTALSMNLWLYAQERSDDVNIIQSLLAPGGIYVDIGANIGDLVLAGAQAVGANGRVFAFEAHPRIFGLMSQNVRLNQRTNIHPVNAACGSEFGWTQFSDMRSDDMNQIGKGDIVVPVIPAQYLLPEADIDLIKIDVEGFELFVLKGLEKSLGRTRHLLIEVGDAHFEQFGYRYADIHQLLTAQGFTIFAQDKAKGDYGWHLVVDGDHPFPLVQNVVASRDPQVRQLLAQ